MSELRSPGRPQGSKNASSKLLTRLKAKMVEESTLLPDEALVQLREGSVTCTLCHGEKAITVERRRNHNRVAVPTEWVEQADGKVREVAVSSDTLVECSSCFGSGFMHATMKDLISIESAMMAHVHPKVKQIEVEQKIGKQLPKVTRLTSIRDPEILQEKIMEMHAAEQQEREGGDDEGDL